jgi:hypothetical protein
MALIRSARLASTARSHRANPVDQIQWTAPAAAQSAGRRGVVSPAQAMSASQLAKASR